MVIFPRVVSNETNVFDAKDVETNVDITSWNSITGIPGLPEGGDKEVVRRGCTK